MSLSRRSARSAVARYRGVAGVDLLHLLGDLGPRLNACGVYVCNPLPAPPSQDEICASARKATKTLRGTRRENSRWRKTVRTAAATINAARIKPASRLPEGATRKAVTISNLPVKRPTIGGNPSARSCFSSPACRLRKISLHRRTRRGEARSKEHEACQGAPIIRGMAVRIITTAVTQ
jgi:hypothetical protein